MPQLMNANLSRAEMCMTKYAYSSQESTTKKDTTVLLYGNMNDEKPQTTKTRAMQMYLYACGHAKEKTSFLILSSPTRQHQEVRQQLQRRNDNFELNLQLYQMSARVAPEPGATLDRRMM